MSKLYYAAQAIACTVVLLTLTTLAFGQGLHYSPQELTAWRQRATSGPYRIAGDAGTNTPPDWSRIQGYADDFRASNLDTGNTIAESLDIWTGYRYQYDSLGQYPVWQGVKMAAAGFKYLLSGDATYGQAVRQALLAQVRFTHPTHIGYNVATWPTPSNGNALPSNESGAHEAVWLSRLLFAYDYTKNLYSSAERTEIEAYFRDSAWYFAGRVHTVLVQNFPLRLQNNYSVKTYAAAPGGVIYWTPPVYNPAQYPRHQVWGDGFVYTHRNANGTLGNKLPRTAFYYNNRVYDKTHFIGMCGIATGDTMLTWHAKQTCREFIRYSVFPDGTYGEYERDGDYGNPNQGAFLYGSINVQCVTLLADALARRGDFSLYNFSTTDGVHGTQVPTGGQPKTLFTVLNKYAQTDVGSPSIYHGAVDPLNRIDINNEVQSTTYTINHVTWDYLLGVANKYYQSQFLKDVYLRHSNVGAMPYPTTRLSSAGKIWVPWSGTGAEYPGMLFMFGQMENVDVYSVPCNTPAGLAASALTTTGAHLAWSASPTAARGYRLSYKTSAGSAYTSIHTNTPVLDLSTLAPGTAYVAHAKSLCAGNDSSASSSDISFTTAAPACPAATNVSVTPISSTSLSVDADPATGGLQYLVEYRTQGASTWSQTTVSTLPTVLINLSPLTVYEVRLTTICTSNQSTTTAIVTSTTLADVCTQGSNLRGTPFGISDSARIGWTAGNGAIQYQVRLRPQGSSNWKFVVVSTTSYTEAPLLSGTTYEFQVNSVCPAAISGFTAAQTFAMPVPPCAAPTGVAIGSILQTSASIAFTGPGPRYEVRYRTANLGNWMVDTATASPVAISGLTVRTQYEVQVRTLCNGSASPLTGSALFTTQSLPCLAATSVIAAATSPTNATVTFGNTSLAEVSYRLQGATAWQVAGTGPSPFALTGLQDGSSYQVRIAALCGPDRAPDALGSFATPRATTPCDTVTGIAANNITQTSTTITWQGTAQAYNLRYRRVGEPTWTSNNLTTAGGSLAFLTGAATYELQVQSLCAGSAQSPWTASHTFTTLSPPCAAPAGLIASLVSIDSMVALWGAVQGSVGYRIRVIGITTPGFRDYNVAASNNPGFHIGAMLPGQRYVISVQSFCPSGESDWIASDTFQTLAPCIASGLVRRETWTGQASWAPGQGTPSRPAEYVAPLSVLRDSLTGNPATLHRVRGYICAPANGFYVIALGASTRAELRMSRYPGDTLFVTHVIQLNSSMPLNSYGPTQKTVPIPLLQGGRYFVEILYYGADSLSAFSLAWRIPGTSAYVPVPADRFSTAAPATGIPLTAITAQEQAKWMLAPNPAGSEGTRLFGPSGVVQVYIHDATGRLLANADRTIQAGTPADLSDILPATPGVYTIVAKTANTVYRSRLVRE